MTGPQAHSPQTQSHWLAGPGRTPQGRAFGRGRAPHPGRPTPRQEAPSSRSPLCCPHSAQSQLARARAEGLVTGLHAHIPRTHSQWVAGPGRTPQGRAVRWGTAPIPGRPTPRQEARPLRRPRAAPTARKASSGGQARPQGGERPQTRQGDEGTGPSPPELNRRGTGPGQETRRGTTRLERPYRGTAPEPRVVRAPNRLAGEGGGGTYTAGARAHPHPMDTRRGPEGQPDRARGMHRPHGMANRQAKGRDTRTGQPATRTVRVAREGRSQNLHRPRPPRLATSAAHTRPGDCDRQGSSSTQCYAPTPRLGSLRASPWGSHGQQASSTGPATPAALATTHQGGGVVGKRLQPRLLSVALTGESRNAEAREGQGSDPREPAGLRHQAGGVA